MKLEYAARMGAVCGLDEPEEWVMNIERHAGSLFKYSEIQKEMDELLKEYKLFRSGYLDIDYQRLKEEEEQKLNEYFNSQQDNI